MKTQTKQEKDRQVFKRFNTLLSKGYTKTQATYQVMSEFKILSDMTIYNIRKRCCGQL